MATPSFGQAMRSLTPATPRFSRLDLRVLVAAFRRLAAASAITVLLGVATNKLVALVAGTQGVALVGLYRQMTAVTASALGLGCANVILQRISTAVAPESIRQTILGAWRLFVLQALALILLATLASPIVARVLFGVSAEAHLSEVRLTFLMVGGVLSLQMVNEILNGLIAIRRVIIVNLSTAAGTLVGAYPLLMLGNIGIPLLLGVSCYGGAALGAVLVAKTQKISIANLLRALPLSRQSLAALPISGFVTLRTIGTSAALFYVQILINRRFGTPSLGLFAAALTIEMTAIQVLMSGMRSYFLPSLGRLETETEKGQFVARVLLFLLAVLVPAIAVLEVISRPLLQVLFSGRFVDAERLVSLIGVSLFAQTFLYAYGFYVLHRGHYGRAAFLDIGWALTLVALTSAVAFSRGSLESVVMAYVTAQILYAIAYIVTCRIWYTRAVVGGVSMWMGLAGLAWVVTLAWAKLAAQASTPGYFMFFGSTAAVLVIGALRSLRKVG